MQEVTKMVTAKQPIKIELTAPANSQEFLAARIEAQEIWGGLSEWEKKEKFDVVVKLSFGSISFREWELDALVGRITRRLEDELDSLGVKYTSEDGNYLRPFVVGFITREYADEVLLRSDEEHVYESIYTSLSDSFEQNDGEFTDYNTGTIFKYPEQTE